MAVTAQRCFSIFGTFTTTKRGVPLKNEQSRADDNFLLLHCSNDGWKGFASMYLSTCSGAQLWCSTRLDDAMPKQRIRSKNCMDASDKSAEHGTNTSAMKNATARCQ
jgi:hypothetical protein